MNVEANEKFTKGLCSILYSIEEASEDNGLLEMKSDLLYSAFQQLLGSEWFMSISALRRQQLFAKYDSLYRLLRDLDDFAELCKDVSPQKSKSANFRLKQTSFDLP